MAKKKSTNQRCSRVFHPKPFYCRVKSGSYINLPIQGAKTRTCTCNLPGNFCLLNEMRHLQQTIIEKSRALESCKKVIATKDEKFKMFYQLFEGICYVHPNSSDLQSIITEIGTIYNHKEKLGLELSKILKHEQEGIRRILELTHKNQELQSIQQNQKVITKSSEIEKLLKLSRHWKHEKKSLSNLIQAQYKEIQGLRKSIESSKIHQLDLMKRIDELEADMKTHLNHLEKCKQKYIVLKEKLVTSKQNQISKETQVDLEYQLNEISELRNENTHFRQKLSDMKMQLSSQESLVSNLQNRKESIASEVLLLKSENDTLKESMLNKTEDFETQIQNKDKEIRGLRLSLEKLQQSNLYLEESLMKTQEEISIQLKERIEQKAKSLASSISSLENETFNLRSENKMLNVSNEELHAKIKQLEAKLKSKEDEIKELIDLKNNWVLENQSTRKPKHGRPRVRNENHGKSSFTGDTDDFFQNRSEVVKTETLNKTQNDQNVYLNINNKLNESIGFQNHPLTRLQDLHLHPSKILSNEFSTKISESVFLKNHEEALEQALKTFQDQVKYIETEVRKNQKEMSHEIRNKVNKSLENSERTIKIEDLQHLSSDKKDAGKSSSLENIKNNSEYAYRLHQKEENNGSSLKHSNLNEMVVQNRPLITNMPQDKKLPSEENIPPLNKVQRQNTAAREGRVSTPILPSTSKINSNPDHKNHRFSVTETSKDFKTQPLLKPGKPIENLLPSSSYRSSMTTNLNSDDLNRNNFDTSFKSNNSSWVSSVARLQDKRNHHIENQLDRNNLNRIVETPKNQKTLDFTWAYRQPYQFSSHAKRTRKNDLLDSCSGRPESSNMKVNKSLETDQSSKDLHEKSEKWLQNYQEMSKNEFNKLNSILGDDSHKSWINKTDIGGTTTSPIFVCSTCKAIRSKCTCHQYSFEDLTAEAQKINNHRQRGGEYYNQVAFISLKTRFTADNSVKCQTEEFSVIPANWKLTPYKVKHCDDDLLPIPKESDSCKVKESNNLVEILGPQILNSSKSTNTSNKNLVLEKSSSEFLKEQISSWDERSEFSSNLSWLPPPPSISVVKI